MITTLNDKKGTLAFSIMNLVEVINKGDLEQIEKIKEFLDAVDVVLIDINPHKVIMREKMHVNGITELSPSADIEFLSNYALCVGSNLESFTASDIVAKALDEIDCFKYSFDHYFDKVLCPIVTKARSDVKALSKAKTRLTKKSRQSFPCTEQIYSKCIDFIVVNQSMNMPEKEWRDVFNLIVPAAYCDYALADSRWVHFIRSTDLEYPYIAKVYNYRRLNEFLDDLEMHVCSVI